MACAPSEDSDQPWYPPSLIRLFAVSVKKAQVLSYPLSAQRRLWSDWADALSLRWAHMAFCWFCHEAAQLFVPPAYGYRCFNVKKCWKELASRFQRRCLKMLTEAWLCNNLTEIRSISAGGPGFDPGSRNTKVVKMVLAAPHLALRFTG